MAVGCNSWIEMQVMIPPTVAKTRDKRAFVIHGESKYPPKRTPKGSANPFNAVQPNTRLRHVPLKNINQEKFRLTDDGEFRTTITLPEDQEPFVAA